MESNLLDLTVRKLLEKFGKGEHKPGSGSAAAFEGMISAQLLITVISLTCDEKRKEKYGPVIPEMEKIRSEIQDNIFPKLSDLFSEDSIQFDKTIRARTARDEETDKIKKGILNKESLSELKISTNIPWHISQECIKLCDAAIYVFDEGFKSARGDSQVALSGAVSALGGCISIIRLNLLSFKSDEFLYIEKVLSELEKLEIQYDRLNKSANLKMQVLKDEVGRKIPLLKGASQFVRSYKSKNLSDREIEQCTIDLRKLMVEHKDSIWPDQQTIDTLELLRPEIVLKKVLGYNFHIESKLDAISEDGQLFDIAGLINQDIKLVLLSNEFDKETLNFTAAHELGHALMHSQSVLHRDVPINSLGQYRVRNKNERQADKFASYFLMPETTVREVFFDLFGTSKLNFNEDVAFKLINSRLENLRKKCKNKRQFARLVSSAKLFDHISFPSLSEVFIVSVEAMAIRLEELDLIGYEFDNNS